MNEVRSQLLAAFTGYHDGAVLRSYTNRQTRQQHRYKCKYKYNCRPHVASNPQP
jgi:hypothetical protein